jgi:hypothetical protein
VLNEKIILTTKGTENTEGKSLSRFRGMMNTPRLAAQFLAFALFDTAQLAARSFIFFVSLVFFVAIFFGAPIGLCCGCG